jgi:hypothetical protein
MFLFVCACVVLRVGALFFEEKRVTNIIESAVAAVRDGFKDGEFASKAKYKVLAGRKHTVVVGGKRYCCVRALRGFERPFGLPSVEPGDLGGFVAVSGVGAVLSHEGSCWVADEAFVAGHVSGNSQVTGHAFVGVSRRGLNPGFGGRAGQTRVGRYSWVSGRARVPNGAMVDRFGRVDGSAVVAGDVQVRRGSVVAGRLS